MFKTIKSSVIPDNIQYIQRYIVAGFLYYGSKDYDGILNDRMFGEFGKLYNLLKDHDQYSPEVILELNTIGYPINTELLDLGSGIDGKSFLVKYAKDLFDWYVSLNTEVGVKNLEKIKNIYARLDMLATGKKEDNVMDLFLKVENQIEIAKNKGNEPLGYKTGIKLLDKYCEGLQQGTVMRINGYSNIGKSKLAYFITNNLLRLGKSVAIFSLEVTSERLLLNLISNWYQIDYNDLAKGRKIIDFSEYYEIYKKQIRIIENMFELSEIINYTDINKPDIVVIDFVQNITIRGSSNEYERMSEIAVQIQQMAIRNNIAVLDLSQIANEGTEWKIGQKIPSKGSGSLVASADVGLMLYRRDNQLKLSLAKNKFGPAMIETVLEANFSKGVFKDLETQFLTL